MIYFYGLEVKPFRDLYRPVDWILSSPLVVADIELL